MPQVSPEPDPIPTHPSQSCTAQNTQSGLSPVPRQRGLGGILTLLAERPREPACCPFFLHGRRQPSGLPTHCTLFSPGLECPQPGEGSKGKPRCSSQPPGSSATASLLAGARPGQCGLLTCHYIQVRQRRGGLQRSRGREQGHSSRQRCVGHLQDQRGLEEMRHGKQVSTLASDHCPPVSSLFLASLHQGIWL